MKDLVIWFKDEAVELLNVEDFSVEAAQEHAHKFERGAWISRQAVQVKAVESPGSTRMRLYRKAAETTEWPDFLEGLELIADPICQEKLARAYLQGLLHSVNDAPRSGPERLWLILPATIMSAAGYALRRAAMELYPAAKAVYVIWEDLVLGIGLAQALSNKAKLKTNGETFDVAALTLSRAQFARMVLAHFAAHDDLVQLHLGGRWEMPLDDIAPPAVLFHGVELVLVDSAPGLMSRLPAETAVEPFSWQILLRYGLTTLLNPTEALKLEITMLPTLGFGFADGDRIDLPLTLSPSLAAATSGYFAFRLAAEASTSNWDVKIFSECRGGPHVGRALGNLTLHGSKSSAAIAGEVQKELLYSLGVFAAPDFRIKMRLHDQRPSHLLAQHEFILPGMMC